MNAHDLTMLGTGANAGICLMFLAQFLRDRVEDRRDRKLLAETRAKLNADREASR